MKRILIIVPFVIAVVLTGCLKDKPNVDLSKTGVVAEIGTANTAATVNEPASGLAYFNNANLSFPDTNSYTVWFTVNIASDNPPTKDIPITLAVDQQALANYISNPDNVQFVVFPDSTFTISSLTGTVKAGNKNRLDTFFVTFNPQKISPAFSYMLPLSITAAPGCTISGNLGTIYFHIVGNPLAGTYNVTGVRYNYTGIIGYNGGPIPAGYVSTTSFPGTSAGVPVDPTDLALDFANLGSSGYQIIVNYDPSVSTTAISVSENAYMQTQVSNFKVITQTYDPVARVIHVVSTYNNAPNAAGNDRIVDETYTHQ
jgi:hypothetical protein